MELAIKVLAVIILSYGLGKITDKIIDAFNLVSKSFSVGKFEITAVLMALLTSLPETIVAVSSSLKGENSLALGNAVGANIVNLSLVIGVTAVVGKSLHFKHGKIKKYVGPALYGLIPFLMIADGVIARNDGAILLLIYARYVYGLIKEKDNGQPKEIRKSMQAGLVAPGLVTLLFWVGLLIGCSEIIVNLARGVAMDLNIPMVFIGLFLVSVGTTLPEMVFNIRAAKKREVSMSLGNVIGSCVTNATFVIGLAAMISPITVVNPYQVILPGLEFVFTLALLIAFIYSKHRLDAWEGVVLISLFGYYGVLGLLFK